MLRLLPISLVALSALLLGACAFIPRSVDISAVEGRIVYSREAFAAVHHVAFGPFEDRRPSRTRLGVGRNKMMMVTTSVGIEGDLPALFEKIVRQNLATNGIGEGRSPITVKGAVLEATTDAVGPDHVYVQVTASLTILNSTTNVPILHRVLTGRAVTPVTQISNSAWEDAFVGALNQVSGEVQQIAGLTANTLRSAAQVAQPPATATPGESAITSSDVDTFTGSAKVAIRKNAYAVAIGIEQYREKLPKADFADRDATLMGEYLTKVLGYPAENVIVRLNDRATRTDMVKYFEEWLKNNVEPGGSVFVYYSGHGAPNPKTGEAYLVPYDGDPSFVDSTAYPLKQLYAALDKLPAKDITVVLDSCFSGAGGRSVLAKGARPMVLSMENPMLASSKAVVLAASGGDQISNTFEAKGHGLMTYFFLKGLQGDGDLNKDGKLDMTELFEYVKPNVQRIARKQYNNEQTPQLMGSPALLKNGGGWLLELR